MLNYNSSTFKIFVGKIPEKTTVQDIRPLFETFGKVLQCDLVKNYAFVVSIRLGTLFVANRFADQTHVVL